MSKKDQSFVQIFIILRKNNYVLFLESLIIKPQKVDPNSLLN